MDQTVRSPLTKKRVSKSSAIGKLICYYRLQANAPSKRPAKKAGVKKKAAPKKKAEPKKKAAPKKTAGSTKVVAPKTPSKRAVTPKAVA